MLVYLSEMRHMLVLLSNFTHACILLHLTHAYSIFVYSTHAYKRGHIFTLPNHGNEIIFSHCFTMATKSYLEEWKRGSKNKMAVRCLHFDSCLLTAVRLLLCLQL